MNWLNKFIFKAQRAVALHKRKRLANKIFRTLGCTPFKWQLDYCISDSPNTKDFQWSVRRNGKTLAIIARALMVETNVLYPSREVAKILSQDKDCVGISYREKWLLQEYYRAGRTLTEKKVIKGMVQTNSIKKQMEFLERRDDYNAWFQ